MNLASLSCALMIFDEIKRHSMSSVLLPRLSLIVLARCVVVKALMTCEASIFSLVQADPVEKAS